MTPFQQELFELIKQSKNDINPFSTETEEAGKDIQRISDFATKWDFKDKFENVAREYLNLKERVDKDKKEVEFTSLRSILKEIILIMDEVLALQTAIENTLKSRYATEEYRILLDPIKKGFSLISSNLESILTRRQGGIILPTIGEPLDPSKHKAISAEHKPGFRGNFISEVYRPGYYVLNKVIREAEVKVTCGTAS